MSRKSFAMSWSHLGFGAERIGLSLGVRLEGLVHIPDNYIILVSKRCSKLILTSQVQIMTTEVNKQ